MYIWPAIILFYQTSFRWYSIILDGIRCMVTVFKLWRCSSEDLEREWNLCVAGAAASRPATPASQPATVYVPASVPATWKFGKFPTRHCYLHMLCHSCLAATVYLLVRQTLTTLFTKLLSHRCYLYMHYTSIVSDIAIRHCYLNLPPDPSLLFYLPLCYLLVERAVTTLLTRLLSCHCYL